jgi:hypothetical protein
MGAMEVKEGSEAERALDGGFVLVVRTDNLASLLEGDAVHLRDLHDLAEEGGAESGGAGVEDGHRFVGFLARADSLDLLTFGSAARFRKVSFGFL